MRASKIDTLMSKPWGISEHQAGDGTTFPLVPVWRREDAEGSTTFSHIDSLCSLQKNQGMNRPKALSKGAADGKRELEKQP